MKYKFVKKVALFLSPILIGLYPLDLLISSQLKKSNAFNGEIEVWEAIRNGKANCDIAVYGSSRAWLQFDPEIVATTLNKSVYNFGMDGHNFWLQYYRHLELLKYNKAPETILLSVDVFTLEKRDNLYQLEQFLPYALWNPELRKYTQSYHGFSSSDYYIPFFRYAGKFSALKEVLHIITRHNGNGQKTRTKGFKSFDLKWGDKQDIVNANLKYIPKLDLSTIQLLERFIKECKQEGIQLIFVYAPEQKEGQNKIANREAITNIYEELARKYDLLYLNYSKDKIHLNKKYFYNSMHLNSQGAALFSKKLSEDLIRKLK